MREKSGNNGKYLVIDSGGTKVAAILYDENFRLIAKARSGSLRANTTAPGQIDANFNEMMSQLGLEAGAQIEKIGGTFEANISQKLQKYLKVREIAVNGECDMGLCAAGLFGDGILALSGTGATVFARYSGKVVSAGGYGAMVSDEGSGYWIGRQATIAAIHDFEGRGQSTLLTPIISRAFLGKTNENGNITSNSFAELYETDAFWRARLREAIFSIYQSRNGGLTPVASPVAKVASLVPLVVEAAGKGDEIAQKILGEAAELLADQTICLIKNNKLPSHVAITVAGSVWKKNPIFYDNFRAKINNFDEKRAILLPEFEPIVGPVRKHMFERGVEDSKLFLDEYSDFRINI